MKLPGSVSQYGVHRQNPAINTSAKVARVFTRKDGSMGASYEVTAMNVRFLPSGGDGGGFSQDKGAEQGGVEDDDIPF